MSEENKDLKKGEKEEKNVSIPKNKLDEILSLVKEQGQALKAQSKEIENLKLNGVEQTPRIAKKIKDHYCNLRKHNGKIVTGFASQVYNEWDERRKEFILYIDLQLEDETVAKKVKYLDFVSNAERLKVKILSQKDEEKSTIEAMIQQKEPEGEFGTILTDVLVPVESIEKIYTYTVDLGEGKTLELNQSVINI